MGQIQKIHLELKQKINFGAKTKKSNNSKIINGKKEILLF